MTSTRESRRSFWVVNPNSFRVQRWKGYRRWPGKGVWWFPEAFPHSGYMMTCGVHCFVRKAAAVARAKVDAKNAIAEHRVQIRELRNQLRRLNHKKLGRR